MPGAVTKLPAAINDTVNSLTGATEHPLIVSRGDIVDRTKGNQMITPKIITPKIKEKEGKLANRNRRLAAAPVRRHPPALSAAAYAETRRDQLGPRV